MRAWSCEAERGILWEGGKTNATVNRNLGRVRSDPGRNRRDRRKGGSRGILLGRFHGRSESQSINIRPNRGRSKRKVITKAS